MSFKPKAWVQKIVYVALFLSPLPGAATRLLGKHIAKPAVDNPNIFVVVYDQSWVTLVGAAIDEATRNSAFILGRKYRFHHLQRINCSGEHWL